MVTTFTDDKQRKINAHEGNILHWRGEYGGPYQGTRNAIVAPFVFLTLVDGTRATLRDQEASRFLDLAENEDNG